LSVDSKTTQAHTQPVNITKRAYAQRNSVSPRTVDHWRAQGLPALVIGRRKVLIPVDIADAWIRDRFLIASGKTMARLAARVGGGVA
jgi:phage terminase Nu1 subunit (DNA packaging protein)